MDMYRFSYAIGIVIFIKQSDAWNQLYEFVPQRNCIGIAFELESKLRPFPVDRVNKRVNYCFVL